MAALLHLVNSVADAIKDEFPHVTVSTLAYLETVVPESGYLVGDSLSVADLAVTTCFIQARYGDYDVDGGAAPKLRNYLDRAFAAPLVVQRLEAEKAAMPPGLL